MLGAIVLLYHSATTALNEFALKLQNVVCFEKSERLSAQARFAFRPKQRRMSLETPTHVLQKFCL